MAGRQQRNTSGIRDQTAVGRRRKREGNSCCDLRQHRYMIGVHPQPLQLAQAEAAEVIRPHHADEPHVQPEAGQRARGNR
ncbi:hypothetical protein BGX30_002844 [Mortierella sp. GBA39]|nr:hypothetical protein BGX30_002844 [Mortierella sp. GBA39]